MQRRIGLKVLELGANCVLGYQQFFDLEGEYGIVVRGIGTTALIVKRSTNQNSSINVKKQELNVPKVAAVKE